VTDQTGTVSRVMRLVLALSESHEPLGVTHLATAIGLPPSTTHRLLELLTQGGFVQQSGSTRKYAVGPTLLRIAHRVVARSPVLKLVQPALDAVAAQTGETALFAMYSAGESDAVYLAKSDSPNRLRFRIEVNRQVDMLRAAAGLAVLALLPEAERSAIIAASTLSPRKAATLRARLAQIAHERFAVSEADELPDMIGVAVPLTTPSGAIAGSIAIVVPRVRFDERQLAAYRTVLADAARRLMQFEAFVAS
jgi:DNA-binding IclR family transcriptional regulator